MGVHVEVLGSGQRAEHDHDALARGRRVAAGGDPRRRRAEETRTTSAATGAPSTSSSRLRRSGNVDLGEIALPYWRPVDKRYDVARAPLGCGARRALGRGRGGRSRTRPPSSCPACRGRGMRSRGRRVRGLTGTTRPRPLVGGDRRVAVRVRHRGGGPRGRAAHVSALCSGGGHRRRRSCRERLAEARTACDKDGCPRAADAAIARASKAASVAHAGVSIRGAVGGEVAERLARAGVARATAESVADLLRECEAARFAPDEADIAHARGRWDRARGAIRGMGARGCMSPRVGLAPRPPLSRRSSTLAAGGARAAEEADGLFASGVSALNDGRPGDAIAALEALADRGVVDPVASYDRGLAYVRGACRIGAEVPGDLGRAAHGFEEARDLTHDGKLADDANKALTVVRSEVARRRVRAGQPVEVDPGRSLSRALAGLLSEGTWGVSLGRGRPGGGAYGGVVRPMARAGGAGARRAVAWPPRWPGPARLRSRDDPRDAPRPDAPPRGGRRRGRTRGPPTSVVSPCPARRRCPRERESRSSTRAGRGRRCASEPSRCGSRGELSEGTCSSRLIAPSVRGGSGPRSA